MDYVYLIILLSLAQYCYFTGRVGAARGKLGVEAPKISGNEDFERIFRVQQNTMEQLVVFIPGMLAFAHYVSPLWALLPGVIFLVGRQMYSSTYTADAKKRAPGAVTSIMSGIALVVGALIGLIWKLI
jgi:glutathione S-transferase